MKNCGTKCLSLPVAKVADSRAAFIGKCQISLTWAASTRLISKPEIDVSVSSSFFTSPRWCAARYTSGGPATSWAKIDSSSTSSSRVTNDRSRPATVAASNAGGGAESPKPGRSIATTVKSSRSRGMTLRHSYHEAGHPWPSNTTGPLRPTT